jgi:hypothetical protein
MESQGANSRLTWSKDNLSVKAVMDFSCKDKSGINIFKLMVLDSAHKISVVYASINTKRCRTGRYE